VGTAEQIHYNFIAAIIDRKKLVRFAQGICNADVENQARKDSREAAKKCSPERKP